MIGTLRTIALATTAILCLGAGAAQATVITFASAPDAVSSYTTAGVTFTTVDSGTLYSTRFGNTPNGTRGYVGYDAATDLFRAIRADISGGAGMVSIDLGDNGSDDDTIFLEAFDAANLSLGFASFFVPSSFFGMNTLSITAAGIDHVVYGSTGLFPNSVYSDNFTFDGGGVPEPAAWALMLMGFGGLGAVMRNRRKAAAFA